MSSKWLATLTLVLCSCSGARPEQINLLLETRPDRPASIDAIAAEVAREADMRVTKKTLQFGESASAAAFLIHDYSVSMMIQQALDDCPGPKVSFDPCFSASRYNVSIYRTSLLPAGRPLRLLAQIVQREAQKHDARAYPDPAAVNDT
jgi:hypothetical protein